MNDVMTSGHGGLSAFEPTNAAAQMNDKPSNFAPRISVIMPSYNAAATLPRAIASLLLQTFQDWELILVDDGSTDQTEALIADIPDARIRYVRLPFNQGRGVARQHALDLVRGEYMAMLDADDWLYSGHLANLVEVIMQDKRLALVSAGLCIVDPDDRLVGVRAGASPEESGAIRGPLTRLGPPPVAHASSIIRTSVAQQSAYDPRLKLAQDVDFLLQIMMGRHYAVLGTHSYVYTEHATITAVKVASGLRYSRMTFRKYRREFPVASRRNEWAAMGKEVVYRVGFAIGQRKRLIERRSISPAPEQFDEYYRQLAVVERATQQLRARDGTSAGTS